MDETCYLICSLPKFLLPLFMLFSTDLISISDLALHIIDTSRNIYIHRWIGKYVRIQYCPTATICTTGEYNGRSIRKPMDLIYQ